MGGSLLLRLLLLLTLRTGVAVTRQDTRSMYAGVVAVAVYVYVYLGI